MSALVQMIMTFPLLVPQWKKNVNISDYRVKTRELWMCIHLFYLLSIYNSIRVEHGDYLENVGFSQAHCKWAGTHQKLQRALHYPASIGFSRVHSGRQENQWTIP